MDYLLDTVTIVRHLTNSGKIPDRIRKILDNKSGENQFFIAAISLMEILYLADKNRINVSIDEVIETIEKSVFYQFVDLSPEIIIEAKNIDFYELHDRMILATALYLNIPIISSDRKFKALKNIKVIW